ncbi:phosphotransferase [Sporichthya polymorpha]|uniref:phosphotransferase n=1 Tax=Sporichthya polymorpha TaxID=35751 RepID=UPI000379F4A8|nr:phosphotransferase [Sporichthya polymorpha]
MPLPMSVDEVDSWLQEVLGVEKVEQTGIVWGTATKVLVEVAHPDGSTARLCVKGGFRPELLAIMSAGYQAEALFYRDVAPQLEAGIPRCHHAAVEGRQGIVILDDVIAAGARVNDPRVPMTVDQVSDGLVSMAAWHRRGDLQLDWMPPFPYYRPIVDSLFAPEHWDAYIGQTTAGPVLEVFAEREQIGAAYKRLWAAQDARPATFVHGDANPTNVYFGADGSTRFLDWQFACRTDAYQDVACFLVGSLSTEDRRANEQALLREYLAARGEGAESFDDAWTAYRTNAVYGAVYCLTPEEMQPATVRAPLADRYAQAALDLETLSLLR